jgi:hypothetical protein
VGGTIVVDVVLVDAVVVDVLELLDVLDVTAVLLVDVAGEAVMVKTLPTFWAGTLVHTTRVALTPAVLVGSGPVEPTKAPLAVPTNPVVDRGVPVAVAPGKTSNVPSKAPVPRGHPAPTKLTSVPGGPVSGWIA